MAAGAPVYSRAAMKVVLISPYEIGRQPFGLAEPAALLVRAGFAVECIDLSRERLEAPRLHGAALVALYLAMHTATRIAVEALPRIRELAPSAHLCAYGLYAPMNHARLHELGVTSVFGGEFEPALVALARAVEGGAAPVHPQPPEVSIGRVPFVVPHRAALPALPGYARLELPDGRSRTIGFAEGSRGCRHRCRHCPVVPVYHGRFRVVPVEVVLEDIANQVAAGAEHISFGDPDFLNGPTHALRIVRAMHERFPALTYDATIKIEHLIRYSDRLPELAATGCLFVTSAVESVDDRVLGYLDKGHTRADFERAVALMREAWIALTPTFVPFTPWTTIEGYIGPCSNRLGRASPSSSRGARPSSSRSGCWCLAGSHLFRNRRVRGTRLDAFDDASCWAGRGATRTSRSGPPCRRRIQEAGGKAAADREDWPRRTGLRSASGGAAASKRLGRLVAAGASRRTWAQSALPMHAEPWYCCAEPTARQLEDALALPG